MLCETVDIASQYLEEGTYNWYLLVENKRTFEDYEDFKLRKREYFIPLN